jgi:hypothetical protein
VLIQTGNLSTLQKSAAISSPMFTTIAVPRFASNILATFYRFGVSFLGAQRVTSILGGLSGGQPPSLRGMAPSRVFGIVRTKLCVIIRAFVRVGSRTAVFGVICQFVTCYLFAVN